MNRLLKVLAVMFCVGVSTSRSVEARPLYKKVYEELFQEELRHINVDCNRCHTSVKETTSLNAYGRKLDDELGGRNVKDRERVQDALKKSAQESCRRSDRFHK